MDEQLTTAIARLEEFIGTYPEGDPIDADVALTVDDVRLVIEAAKRGADVVEISEIDLSKPYRNDPTQ